MKMEIGFYHGALSDDYEKQANEQGFTLGDKAEFFESVKRSFLMLKLHGYLTDSQADSVCKKIQKNLARNIKKIVEVEPSDTWKQQTMSRFERVE